MKKFLAILCAGMLALAACGDDDDGGDTATEDTSADTSTDDGGGDTGDDPVVEDVGDAAEFLSDEDCNFVLTGTIFNPLGGLTSGDAADFDTADDQFQAIAEAAPDEISTEMQLIADRYSEFVDLIGDVDLSDPSSFQDPEVQAAFQEAESIFDDEFEAASQAVSDYFEENCST